LIDFISDIYRVLNKYVFTSFLDEYCTSGVFSNNAACKRIVRTSVLYIEQLAWTERLGSSRDFERFRKVHISLTTTNVWRVASERSESS